MPIIKTKKGYRAGATGKEYKGIGAKAKAKKQLRAIKASKNKKK